MSMKIALAFLMLAPAFASPMVDEHVLLQASASMSSQQFSEVQSAIKRCSLSLISKATRRLDTTADPPAGCEVFGSDLKKALMEETIPAIEGGIKNDQLLIDLAEGSVSKCNEHLSDNSNLVTNRANDIPGARAQHIECRNVEATRFDTAKAKSQALTSFLGSPSDPCGGKYPEQWKALASCFETQVSYHEQMNTTLYEKVEAYTRTHNEWQTKKDECDKLQTGFEVKYCGWRELAENTIKSYDQCWKQATESYSTTKATVTASFDNNVKEYIAAKRLDCIADATKLVAEPTKSHAQLEHCHAMEVDTSALTLNIPADFPPDKSEVILGDWSVYPGHPGWVGQEYASLSAGKSPHAEVAPCAA